MKRSSAFNLSVEPCSAFFFFFSSLSSAPLKWSPPTCLAGREVAGSPPGVYLRSLLISSAADFSAVNPACAGITDKKERTAATAPSRLALKIGSDSRILPAVVFCLHIIWRSLLQMCAAQSG